MTALLLLASILLAAPTPVPVAVPILAPVLADGLTKLSSNTSLGLADEAKSALKWSEGRGTVVLKPGPALAEGADTHPISPKLAAALGHMNEYIGLIEPTLADPVTHEQLKAALLSPAGVETVASAFRRMFASRIDGPEGPMFPEIGGEATLGTGLELHEEPDPTRPLVRRIAAAQKDPAALGALYAAEPEGMKALDEYGLLRKYLDRLPAWIARGFPPPEKRAEVLGTTVASVLQLACDSYVSDPDGQLEALATQSWSGRYVGRWHMHPPSWMGGSWQGGGGPSGADWEIAKKDGQNLTIAFRADGFDAYDLSPVETGGDPKVISYRSPDWLARFRDPMSGSSPAR